MKQCLIVLVAFLALTGCRDRENKSGDTNSSSLTVEQFEDGIASSDPKIILDVRTPEEFSEGHLRDATLMNFHAPDFKEQAAKLDKNVPVYVYCASGVRSDKAATILRGEGFKDVYVLEKGLNEWTASNKEIVR